MIDKIYSAFLLLPLSMVVFQGMEKTLGFPLPKFHAIDPGKIKKEREGRKLRGGFPQPFPPARAGWTTGGRGRGGRRVVVVEHRPLPCEWGGHTSPGPGAPSGLILPRGRRKAGKRRVGRSGTRGGRDLRGVRGLHPEASAVEEGCAPAR